MCNRMRVDAPSLQQPLRSCYDCFLKNSMFTTCRLSNVISWSNRYRASPYATPAATPVVKKSIPMRAVSDLANITDGNNPDTKPMLVFLIAFSME